jgi:hypothetical protein
MRGNGRLGGGGEGVSESFFISGVACVNRWKMRKGI